MKRFTFGACALALAVLVTGCGGDNHETIGKEKAAVYDDMASTLKGVKTKDDLDKAKPKLEEAKKKLDGINEREKKLGMPTSESTLKQFAAGNEASMAARKRLADAEMEVAKSVGPDALKGLMPGISIPGLNIEFPGGGFPGGGLPGGKIEVPGGPKIEIGPGGGKIEVPGGPKIDLNPGGGKIEVPGGPKLEIPGFPPPPKP